MPGDLLRRPLRHHPPAMNPRAWSHIHDLIGAADRFFVMLDHDHGIAQIAQPPQAGQQPGVIALVQAN